MRREGVTKVGIGSHDVVVDIGNLVIKYLKSLSIDASRRYI
jgi:hypothetical protein